MKSAFWGFSNAAYKEGRNFGANFHSDRDYLQARIDSVSPLTVCVHGRGVGRGRTFRTRFLGGRKEGEGTGRTPYATSGSPDPRVRYLRFTMYGRSETYWFEVVLDRSLQLT